MSDFSYVLGNILILDDANCHLGIEHFLEKPACFIAPGTTLALLDGSDMHF